MPIKSCVPAPTEYTVTFDYGDTTVTRTVREGGTVSDIPVPPSKNIWSSLDRMKPLGTMDKKTALWVYDNVEFTEETPVTGDITVTPSYTEL